MTAQAAKAEAAATRAKAEALQVDLMGDFPDANACAAIEDAWATLQMREATLRGGFRVALDLSVDATAEVDGASAPVEARREHRRRARGRAEAPGGRLDHRADGRPRVSRRTGGRAGGLGCARSLPGGGGDSTVQELRDAVRAREAKAQERTSLLRDADVLEAKAAPPDPEELESVRRDLDSARRAAENVDATASRRWRRSMATISTLPCERPKRRPISPRGVITAAVGHARDVETQHKLAAQTAEAAAKQEKPHGSRGDDVEAAAATLARSSTPSRSVVLNSRRSRRPSGRGGRAQEGRRRSRRAG